MGLVVSLARPGGNVTGLAMQSTDLVGKRPFERAAQEGFHFLIDPG
jgi:hypothetical protein